MSIFFFSTFISHCVWNPRLAIIFFQVTEDIFLLWDYHFTIFWHPLFLLRNISLNVTSLKVIFFSPWLFVIYSFAIKKKIVVSFLMCLDVDFFLFNLFGILDSFGVCPSPHPSHFWLSLSHSLFNFLLFSFFCGYNYGPVDLLLYSLSLYFLLYFLHCLFSVFH